MSEETPTNGVPGSDDQFELHDGFDWKRGETRGCNEDQTGFGSTTVDIRGVGCSVYVDLLEVFDRRLLANDKAQDALLAVLTEMEVTGLLTVELSYIARKHGCDMRLVKAVYDQVRAQSIYPGLLSPSSSAYRLDLLDRVLVKRERGKRSPFVLKMIFAYGPGSAEALLELARQVNRRGASRKTIISDKTVMRLLKNECSQDLAQQLAAVWNSLPLYPLGND